MDAKKSQLYNFTYEAIPIMFHTQTNEFMQYLERDGQSFLKFWWDHVGGRLPKEKLVPFKGMDIEIISVDKITKIVFVVLPRPAEDGEPYFMALVARPERRFVWVKLPTTDMYCLRRVPFTDSPGGTELVAVTPRGKIVPQSGDIPATIEDFKRAIISKVTEPRPTNLYRFP